MATRTWQGISLCSGGGGLDLGLRIARGIRTVCYVEREAPAVALLAARIQDGSLDDAPIWSDLTTFDGRPWRGRVDIVFGGVPCQPFSVAGQQRGVDDERNLWPEVRRIIGEAGPGVVFLENVPGILRYYHDTIRPELRALGYRVEETLIKASDVGAPHGRERLFILGLGDSYGSRAETTDTLYGRGRKGPPWSGICGGSNVDDAGCVGGERLGGHGGLAGAARAGEGDSGQRERLRDAADDPEPHVGHTEGHLRRAPRGDRPEPSDGTGYRDVADAQGTGRRQAGRQQRRSQPALSGPPVHDEHVVNPDESGSQGRRDGQLRYTNEQTTRPRGGALADASERRWGAPVSDDVPRRRESDATGLGAFPPGPDDLDAWAHVLAEMQALEPALCRVADGVADPVDLSRAQRLSILGNGVVPLQAAVAFTALWRRLT